MNSQEDFTKSSFSQLFHYFILTETVGGIKIFPSGGIKGCIIFDKLEVIFEILSAFFIEKSKFIEFKELGNFPERGFALADSELQGLFVVARVLIYVNLKYR